MRRFDSFLPFVAVLVLLAVTAVTAVLGWNDADVARAAQRSAAHDLKQAQADLVKMTDAFRALAEVVDINDATLQADENTIPAADAVRDAVRAYLNAVAEEIGKKSEVATPDGTRMRFYDAATPPDRMSLSGLVEPLARAMELAAKSVSTNDHKARTTAEDAARSIASIRSALKTIEAAYRADLANKQRASEDWKESLDRTRADLEALTVRLEELMRPREPAPKPKVIIIPPPRKTTRPALREEPKDGEVLHASRKLGTIWINLGRKHKLMRGTKFTVWRVGKGGVRENICRISVIKVEKTMAECRRLSNGDGFPTKGMNVSSPFFDPRAKLKAYIFGDLKTFPNDIAARRLAAAGVEVVRVLDENVDVIVLGVPPVDVGDLFLDEDEAQEAAKKRELLRAKRLDDVLAKARAIGAIVVTEDVLSDFMEY